LVVTGGPSDAGDERTGVPLGFAVPEGWSTAVPAEVGIPAADFVAVGPAEPGEFTPNITVSTHRRPDGPTVTDLADEALGRAAVAVTEVELANRTEIGDPRAPGVTQVIEVRTDDHQLTQTQVHLAIPLADSPADLLAVELVCTCAPTQTAAVTPVFQEFVAGFHLRDGQS
jgi:hypothetical protein